MVKMDNFAEFLPFLVFFFAHYLLLDASTHLYKRVHLFVGLSVRPSVRLSFRPSVGQAFFSSWKLARNALKTCSGLS